MKVIKEVLETNVESAARRNRMTVSEVETLLKEQEVDLLKEKPHPIINFTESNLCQFSQIELQLKASGNPFEI